MHPTQTISLQNQFLLDPQVIYLNHGSFGATPRPVFESYQRWQRELELQPTEFLGRRASELLRRSREALGLYLGTAADNLSYVTNATTGLNIVARSLALGPGDEILATDHEYGALDRTWKFLAQRQGYKYINHPIPVPVTDSTAFVEQLWKGVTPHTRVIFISHITSPTALTFPVQEICRRAREAGILTVIDGAHAPGQIPLHLDTLGADFYSGNLHKWLCAPKGAAFLYVRPELQDRIEPLIVSWGYQSETPSSSRLVDYTEWLGTRDIAPFLAVPDAIRFQQEHDWDSIQAECHAIAEKALRSMTEMTGLQPLSPVSAEWFAQMVSAPVDSHINMGALHDQIYKENRIEVPMLTWNGHNLVRFSIQAYNTWEQVDSLIQAIKRIVYSHS
jgi:isopenicillin-N epimerase